ncbi:Phospholipase A1 [invertebrate metagenome]|uniref:Phosphatidylcholine 1-acylhydrolase n=1 Tax=invertebrate metagenome TaxID=1711999 RepID=A0A2H9T4D5_9ZZZZ
MKRERLCVIGALSGVALFGSMATYAQTYEECLLDKIKNGEGFRTLENVRHECRMLVDAQSINFQSKKSLKSDSSKPRFDKSSDTNKQDDLSESVIGERIEVEKATEYDEFVITPHKPNYILPVSYNHNVNVNPYRTEGYGDKYDDTEIKFQLSVKAPVWSGIFNGYGNMYVAYTNTSWWQAYNSNSAPFRETNHEPELFLTLPVQQSFLGMNLVSVMPGIVHQSNGKGGTLSRSWNRIYTNFVFERGDTVLSLKPWWRIPEKKKSSPDDSQGDDNPDIEKYMGYGELSIGQKIGEHNLMVMLRNNLRPSGNKGAVQVDWSFPLSNRFKGYVQYFNGYGESLIDYNASVSRLSIGVMLTDWL